MAHVAMSPLNALRYQTTQGAAGMTRQDDHNENGKLVRYGSAAADYQTEVLSRK